jgi:glycine cleavage system transcriptional repressor
MAHYAVMAIGSDRPGIVAAITDVVTTLGGNLEDLAATILRGHFVMMLVVAVPPDVSADRLRKALGQAAAPLGVQITAGDVENGAPERPSPTHLLSVYGSDRPGIVARFSGLLAERGINITDLSCQLTNGEPPIYAMVAEISVPNDTDPNALTAELDAAAAVLGVDVSFKPVQIETL